jgi:transposase
MDKAFPHYKSRKVKDYLEVNKDTLIPVYLPTASPEFTMLEEVGNITKRELLVLKYYTSFEEVGNITKRELLVLKYYTSFEDFKQKVSCYFRTKRFDLNIRNYILRTV